jgi:hypothetical protein
VTIVGRNHIDLIHSVVDLWGPIEEIVFPLIIVLNPRIPPIRRITLISIFIHHGKFNIIGVGNIIQFTKAPAIIDNSVKGIIDFTA